MSQDGPTLWAVTRLSELLTFRQNEGGAVVGAGISDKEHRIVGVVKDHHYDLG